MRIHRGIATALIGETVAPAPELGAHVDLKQADRGDGSATALYTGLGRREDVLHIDIEVPGMPVDPKRWNRWWPRRPPFVRRRRPTPGVVRTGASQARPVPRRVTG